MFWHKYSLCVSHTVKAYICSAHAMMAYRWSRGIAPLILNLRARWRWEVNMMPWLLYLREGTPIPNEQDNMGAWTDLDFLENKKTCFPSWNSIPGSSVVCMGLLRMTSVQTVVVFLIRVYISYYQFTKYSKNLILRFCGDHLKWRKMWETSLLWAYGS